MFEIHKKSLIDDYGKFDEFLSILSWHEFMTNAKNSEIGEVLKKPAGKQWYQTGLF